MLAALIFTLDPLSNMTSQKIWMDTTLAFFTVLSICFYVFALKDQKYHQFLWAGFFCGLAMLTKFTGGIAAVVAVVYAILYDRRLLGNKFFLLSLVLPFIMIIPWLIWNFNVYGFKYIFMQLELHSNDQHMVQLVSKGAAFFIIVLALWQFTVKFRQDLTFSDQIKAGYDKLRKHRQLINICVLAAFFAFFFEKILLGLSISHLPETSWSGFTFYDSAHSFYFYRLIEFSPIYLIAFCAYLMPKKHSHDSERLIYIAPLAIFIFFIIWGSFQSRYIIAAIPFLILIGSQKLLDVFTRARRLQNPIARLAISSSIIFIVLMIFVKSVYLARFLVNSNDFCYY